MPDITCALKRYDGASGSATFTGCIPLKPGQLFETTTGLSSGTPIVAQASLRGNVSLWRTAGPTELQAYITALYPQHPDGSIKSVMVSTTLSAADGEEIPLTLTIGTSPTLAASPTAHPTINALWMKFPRLIGCTDSTHMCQARVAFGPLVPVNDPRLPPNWQALLTTELENGYTQGAGLSISGFPTLKHHLERLHTLGDMGAKLCTVTAGSPVLTILDTGWPTPSSAPTAGLTQGMSAHAAQGGTTIFDTTILSVDSATQVTLNAPAWSGFITRAYGVSFGPRLTYADANYNLLAVFYYRYMTAASGHLDKLRDANLAAMTRGIDVVDWVGKGGPGVANSETSIGVANFGNGSQVRYAAPYTDAAGVVHATDEIFTFDEYGQPFNNNPQGNREDLSGFHQGAYMCYLMSGWQQALGTCIGFGIAQIASNTSYAAFPGHPWADPALQPQPPKGIGTSGFHSPSQQGAGGIRLSFRLRREVDAFLYMLSLPMDLRGGPLVTGSAVMAPSPRMATYPYAAPASGSNRAKWLDFFQRRYWDSVQLWSTEIGATLNDRNGIPRNTAWMAGLWGFSAWYQNWQEIDDPAGVSPLFQLDTAFNALFICHLNIKEDPRFYTKLGELAVFIAEQQDGFGTSALMNPHATARASNPPVHWLPYNATDPAALDNPAPGRFYGINTYTAGNLLAFLTWAWRVTGNAKLLQMADAHCSIYAWTGDPSNTTLTGGAYGWAVKYLGQKFHVAHYAAAWRAGETWGVEAGALSPPTITDEPYETGDTVVTGTGVAGGTVTLFRNGVAV